MKNTTPLPKLGSKQQTSEEQAKPPSMLRKVSKRFLIGFIGLLVTFFVLLTLAISLLLGSQSTREWFIADLSTSLLSSSSIDLSIDGFNSPEFGYWFFESLVLSIDEEELLNTKKLLLHFDALSLLDKKVDVIELSAAKFSLRLVESSEPDETSDNTSLEDLKNMLMPVQVQKLAFHHIEIIDPTLNVPILTLNGHAQLLWQESFFSSGLKLTTQAQPEARINLTANINKQFSGRVNATIQEASGGWIGQLIHLPVNQDVDVDLSLQAQANNAGVNWQLQSFKAPWQQHQINATGKGSWESNSEKFELSQLSLFVDQKEQTIKGWWQDQTFKLNAQFNELPLDLADPFQDYISGGFLSGSIVAGETISKPVIQANLNASTSYQKKAVNIDLEAKGNLSTLTIDDALIKLGEVNLKASGDVLIDQEIFDLKIHRLNGPLSILETFDVTLPEHLIITINELEGSLSGPFTAPQYQGLVKANGHYQSQAFNLKSEFDGDINKVELNDLHAQISTGLIKADGLIDWQSGNLDVQLDVSKLPLSLVSLVDVTLPDDLSATLNTQGRLAGTFTNPNFKGKARSNGQYRKHALAIDLIAAGDLKSLQIEKLLADFGEAHLKASGNIKLEEETLDITIKEFSGPSRLAQLFVAEIPSELLVDVKVNGASINGPFTNPNYKVATDINGVFDKKPLAIKSEFEGDLSAIDIDSLSLKFSGGKLETSGNLDWKNETIDLSIDASNIPASLATIAKLEIPMGFSARANIDGDLKGDLFLPYFKGKASATGDYQATHFDIKTKLSGTPGKIEVENFSAFLGFDQEKNNQAMNEKPDASIQGNGIYTISSNKLEGKINIQNLPYDAIKLVGIERPKSLSGILNADLSISGKLPIPMVYGSLNSEGIFEGKPFNLDVEGSQEAQTLVFDQTTLSWNNTVLSANGKVSKENLNLHLKLNNLNFTDFNQFGYSFKPGTADLEFNLLGSVESPQLNGLMTLVIENQDYSEDLDVPQEDVIITTEFKTENERFMVLSQIEHGQISRGELSIDSGYKGFLDWLINDSGPEKVTEVPLDLKAKGTLGLTWVNYFIDRDIQNISGKLSLDTHALGTIDEPSINGSIALSNGVYINSLSQTSIENAEVKLAFDEKSMTIVKAEATDGQRGTLSFQGKARLEDNDNGEIDLTLKLNNASLVRREDIEGEATGAISLTGDFKKMLLKGDIDVYPFQIMLDLIPSDSIPEIEVSLKKDANQTQVEIIETPPVALDINVSVDQQAFIRGRGLDAELKGKLALTGTTNKPRYDGEFRVIRGTFELFARKFKLEEGDVIFSDEAVSLFVQGRHVGKVITFIASLSGTMDDLKIELRTLPSLPEDEALARLLFGKSVRNITPIQAIQLASAIQTLRGEGGGFDPLGKARELLHVDNISVESQETSEGSGVAVGVGKYISEGVYVELSRTPEPSQPWKGSVEVELTPNINLETTTGGSSGFGGVELQWKNDY